MHSKSIVILTGSGISAESGIPTFRASDGLWCNHPIEDVATPEGFARNPALVQEFYNTRRAQLKGVVPNAAHLAIANLATQWEGRITLITQNVDDLHERAISGMTAKAGYKLLHMHGELNKARCTSTGRTFVWEEDINAQTLCPCCSVAGKLRPHIVWFNEMPLDMELIQNTLQSCNLFISIGTSGSVYPAAGFVYDIRTIGKAHTVELNMEPSLGKSLFHECLYGKATDIVPDYVQRILRNEVTGIFA